LHDTLAEQRAFRDQSQFLKQQAFIQRRDADAQTLGAGQESRPAVHLPGLELESGEQLQQHFAATGRFRAEQYTPAVLLKETAQCRHWFAGLSLDRQIRQWTGLEARLADAWLDILRVDYYPWPVLQAGEA